MHAYAYNWLKIHFHNTNRHNCRLFRNALTKIDLHELLQFIHGHPHPASSSILCVCMHNLFKMCENGNVIFGIECLIIRRFPTSLYVCIEQYELGKCQRHIRRLSLFIWSSCCWNLLLLAMAAVYYSCTGHHIVFPSYSQFIFFSCQKIKFEINWISVFFYYKF